MDEATRNYVLRMLGPMMDAFSEAIAESRARGDSEKKIDELLSYVERSTTFASEEERKFIMGALREAARAGPKQKTAPPQRSVENFSSGSET